MLVAQRDGVRVEAIGLTRADRGVLHDVSATAEPGELVAVTGPSGAGKTTLLRCLAGLLRPSSGVVLHNDEPPSTVGYVPQDDTLHHELPLRRTLLYAARLRMPVGSDYAGAVTRVLAALGLTPVEATRVGLLSGGERKRASIAVELLTQPQVFFLDEPTSGLDPVAADELMRLLRGLASGGTTVVLTTHRPADLGFCHQVWTVEAGRLVATDRLGRAITEEAPEPITGRRLGGFGQWALLTRRGLDILRRNRLTLAILAGSPIAVIMMFAVLFRPGAFSYAHPSPGATAMIMFWVAFGAFFFGLTYGLLQICVETAVLRRERLAGLRVGSYVLSKVAMLVPLLAVVNAAMLGVLRLLDRLPWGLTSMFVTLMCSSLAALALGLLASAAVSDPSQATLTMPMLCFPQVLFSGAILPVPLMAGAGRLLSYAMSNRWAYGALGHAAGLNGLWLHGRSPLGPPLLASYGRTFAGPPVTSWLILGGFTVVLLAATCSVLTRKTS